MEVLASSLMEISATMKGTISDIVEMISYRLDQFSSLLKGIHHNYQTLQSYFIQDTCNPKQAGANPSLLIQSIFD